MFILFPFWLPIPFWVGCTFMHKCWTQRPFVCHCCILGDEPKQKISTRLSSATEKKTVTGRCLEICIYIKMANLSNMHIWITKKRSQIGHPKHVTNLNQIGIYMLSHILISNKLNLFRKGWRRKDANAFWNSSPWFAQNNHHILQFIQIVSALGEKYIQEISEK